MLVRRTCTERDVRAFQQELGVRLRDRILRLRVPRHSMVCCGGRGFRNGELRHRRLNCFLETKPNECRSLRLSCPCVCWIGLGHAKQGAAPTYCCDLPTRYLLGTPPTSRPENSWHHHREADNYYTNNKHFTWEGL